MLNVSISFVLLLNSPVILERVDYEIQMTECIRGELCQPLCSQKTIKHLFPAQRLRGGSPPPPHPLTEDIRGIQRRAGGP